MKVFSIVGARPQFVKLAPFSRAVRSRGWEEVIVHTGQHYNANMSSVFFEELGIPAPDHNLAIGSGDPGAQTARMLEGVERLLREDPPDVVVVFGDTNSTIAGVLAAVKLGVRVVHVEAGLRSFNRTMPEEINRIMADHASDWLFAPTRAAMAHLEREGLEERAYLTGDIMVDVVEDHRERARERVAVLREFGLEAGRYSILTLHRPYTVDDPAVLGRLLEDLADLEETILFPVHPRTRKVLLDLPGKWQSSGRPGKGICLVEPLGYYDFLCLQCHAGRILTDSGGIQKEAYLLGKPCVTLRPETEWVETVEAGWNLLLPPGAADFTERVRGFRPPAEQPPVFGVDVARGMVDLLEKHLSGDVWNRTAVSSPAA